MIDFNEFVLSDKKRFDYIFRSYDYRVNDYSFSNLFIWRKKNNIEIAEHNGFAVVRFENATKAMYLYPIGAGDRAAVIRDMQEDAKRSGKPFYMACVTNDMKAELEEVFPGKFEYIEDRASYDYIYNSEDLIQLSGKKYHSKRNHISRFKALGDWEYEEIGDKNIAECLEMNKQWCRENGCGEDNGLRDEHYAVNDALNYFKELEFAGGLLRLYGKVVAFTIGEMLCKDTFVVHIEKAYSQVEGAYPTINNEFVSRNCVNYRYVNREEDTGDEGLRKAKLSYQPAILLEKDIARLKDGVVL